MRMTVMKLNQKKEDVSKDKPVDEVQKPADESKKDETNLDDKAE